MIASMSGHHNTVSVLLELGAEVDSINDQGKTAMDIAVEKDFSYIVRLLQNHKRKFSIFVALYYVTYKCRD